MGRRRRRRSYSSTRFIRTEVEQALGRELIVPSLVVMKERKTTSALKRILVTCAVQAKDYGACIAAKVPEIERDACLKEFHALRSCMQKLHQGKR